MRTKTLSFPVICYLMLVTELVTAADTIKINLTYKHKLDNEGRSQGFVTVKQKFYTPDQILFREINYNEINSQILDYTFYFYTGDKLNTEECYNQKDSLVYILKHEYDANGREIRIIRYEPLGGSLQVTHRTLNSYDNRGNMVRQKEYAGKKLITSAICYYNSAGLPSREKRKFRPVSQKSTKIENRSCAYNADNSINQVIISGKDISNKSFQETENYTYNDKRLLASVRITGPDYPQGLIKTYKYLDTGAISTYQESNTAGKINALLQYDYKKHYMDKGTQISYFDRKRRNNYIGNYHLIRNFVNL